jgi:hypothetical protein
MNTRLRISFQVAATALAAFVAAPHAFARVESEIDPQEKRHAWVEKAAHLSKVSKAETLSGELPNAFAPPLFDLTDAEEAAAAALAARKSGGPLAPVAQTDRELLEAIASKITPSGTINMGGKPLLMFGKRFVKTGSKFVVTYKGQDYNLELTDIDGTNFTLRYNREEITRPVKPGKSP